jgi:hypothetical protein
LSTTWTPSDAPHTPFDIVLSGTVGMSSSQLMVMGRSPGEQVRQLTQVDAISLLERDLAHPVLLDMVISTETDRPAIRRLESEASISIAADVSTLNRPPQAARYAAVMAAHPGAMRRTLAVARLAGLLALKSVREL